LRHAQNPLKRVKAVMAMRQMPLQRALPILTVALRDRFDDVRLLAFAMRDSAEKQLVDRIQLLNEQLDEMSDSKQAAAYSVLAQDCFELVYSGLVQGAVRQHWLNQSLQYALQAQQSAHNALLLARIHFARHEYSLAQQALDRAQQQGISAQHLAIWRAECAFALRQFNDVVGLISQAQGLNERGSDFAAVKQYWNVATP
jgi:hypothetical protein